MKLLLYNHKKINHKYLGGSDVTNVSNVAKIVYFYKKRERFTALWKRKKHFFVKKLGGFGIRENMSRACYLFSFPISFSIIFSIL